jgi:FtsP/CotA-like multicopper oxidase with cupredoxin domain
MESMRKYHIYPKRGDAMSEVKWHMAILPAIFLLLVLTALPAGADVNVQCDGDLDGDAAWDSPGEEQPEGVKCMHITAGDGFIRMADGRVLYMFGFADITGVPPDQAMEAGMLAAQLPAPTIAVDEDDEFYLNLTNVGLVIRPDLFDAHTVHWHGFPNAAPVFDGVPESSISINMGGTFPFWYLVRQPGTFMWHCHFEATEHMEMGMLGNIYVRPALDGGGNTYAYNDTATQYDVDFPIQIHGMDSFFHDKHEAVQELPFAFLIDDYVMFNGRGYPDTVNTSYDSSQYLADYGVTVNSQPVHSLITATRGQTILLRLSNLSVVNYYTVTALGLTMRVVGTGAAILQGQGGANDLFYDTNSVNIGGGDAVDILIDTTDVPRGTYFLYTTNLNFLSNNEEDYGGMMTEIVIN